MRWLLLKDLQVLKRSPLLVGLLLAYALVIGIPVGFAVSRVPQKPKVAFLNQVPAGNTTFDVGGKEVDAAEYAKRLFAAVDPIRVKTRAEAIQKVRDGEALAALIIPPDATQKLTAALGMVGSSQLPTLEVYYNGDNPLKQSFVQDTIEAELAKANAALSRQLTVVAGQYLQIILKGGGFSLLGQKIQVLGLKQAASILQAVEQTLPRGSPERASIERVRSFAQVAIDNLGLSGAVLGAVSQPIRVDTKTIDGASSSLDGYAIAAALTVALMVVGLLIGAGMLALEREEHAFGRLVRGLVSKTGLVGEKTVLGGLCSLVVGIVLLLLLSLFEPIDFARSGQVAAVLVLAALGFGGLGVVIGAVARDVRAASLLAILLALPIAALALVPTGTVSPTAYDIIKVVSAAFPVKPALQGLDTALNASGERSLGSALVNLGAVVVAYVAVARLALRRFA
jgi:hypothetical protein